MRGFVAVVILVCGLWGSSVSDAIAQAPPPQGARQSILLTSQKESLRGLNTLGVVVTIESEADLEELSAAKVQTQVELRLREARIQVATRAQASQLPGDPVFKLNITVLKSGLVCAYSIGLQVDQQTILKRNPSMEISASTWRSSQIGYATSMKSPGARVIETMNSLLDSFINDWLAVNPK